MNYWLMKSEPAVFGIDALAAEPRWYQVDVRLLRRFARPVTLSMLRQHADGSLRDLCVLRRGNRLSITPVTSGQWHRILELADHSTG